MEYKSVKYGILLSKEQFEVLSRTDVYNRMNVYRAICEKTTIEPYDIVKRGIPLTINRGECLYPITHLEAELGINRKTVQEIIHEFNMVGIIKSVTGNRGTVHINQSLSSWVVEGKDGYIRNPLYKRNPDCQATKGIKPKKSKVQDSIKVDADDKTESHGHKIQTEEMAVEVDKAVNDYPASLSIQEPIPSLISSPSLSESVSEVSPSVDGEHGDYADQSPLSSKPVEEHSETTVSDNQSEVKVDNPIAIEPDSTILDSDQPESPEEKYGQLYEAYMPYLTDEFFIDYSNDVWRKDDGSLVATHDEIAREYFAQMRAKRSCSNSSSSKGVEAVQTELFP